MIVDEKNMEDTNKEIEFLSRKILDLNKKLIESEKAKSRFLSLVASELNNPMTVLKGLVPRLKPDEDSTQSAIFELVDEQVYELNFLVANVVAASEIESGESTLSHALIDVGVIVDEIIDEFRYRTKSKSLLFTVMIEEERKVVCDPQKIAIILKNLIANACSYGRENSLIHLSVDYSEDIMTIRIDNHGDAPQVRYDAELFQRFADGPEGQHGLGLGLSIVRAYTEMMGGKIAFYHDDHQMSFRVDFPISQGGFDACAIGADEFLFESFDPAIEM